jgi:hypothetical protein
MPRPILAYLPRHPPPDAFLRPFDGVVMTVRDRMTAPPVHPGLLLLDATHHARHAVLEVLVRRHRPYAVILAEQSTVRPRVQQLMARQWRWTDDGGLVEWQTARRPLAAYVVHPQDDMTAWAAILQQDRDRPVLVRVHPTEPERALPALAFLRTVDR